ncbi:MAG: RagB/SusD family nutrient uptake outer membrane protein, partial [Bacteroidales bacterium]|nr:RagB/SusD family nutrient uptake outer membrane protein [Bacteroidales bacterium]
MKTICKTIITLGTLGMLLCGCNLDRYPTNQIITENAFQSMTDATNAYNGIYALFRGHFYGTYALASESQSDLFNICAGASSSTAVGTSTPLHRLSTEMLTDGMVTLIWRYCYETLANINNFINNVDRVEQRTPEDQATIVRYKAEAHYMRAYLYYILIKHSGVD